jgi:hypothetical protein
MHFFINELNKGDLFDNIFSEIKQPWSKWPMGFSQMGHSIKLNIRN